MTSSGASFSVATTVFVSLAICALISYGLFYYFKQRLAVIEQSQMEQARIMQAIISRGLSQAHSQGHAPLQQPAVQQVQSSHQYDKELTITQSDLIEVSSDDETETDSISESESESETETEYEKEEEEEDKWSIGDEIHQPDSYHEEFDETFKRNILIDAVCIDGGYVVETITAHHDHPADDNVSNKKIISLNKEALGSDNADADTDADANASDDASDDESSSSSSSVVEEVQDKDNANVHDLDLDLNLKIGYKHKKEPLHLNYGNMSVPALRQLAKERGLGGEDADLQKLKKKDLVQLLQWFQTRGKGI